MKDNFGNRKRKFHEMFLGRSDDPAFGHAFRVAASVILLLLLGLALSGLLRWVGLLPDYLPFSWSGFGEEMLVKPTGAFLGVLFLHLLRWLIRTGRRGLALSLVAATGPLCFSAGLMSFGWAQVFSRDALTSEAMVAWLVLFLVPAIFFGVVGRLRPTWPRTPERSERMPNPNLKRKGRWIQSFGLLIILADAVFGFFMFRGDLGDRCLESVFFPILIAAVVAFASFMVWGGILVRRYDVQDEPTA